MLHNPTFEELATKYREKKLAHAYLIETNNDNLIMEDLKQFIKYINCPQAYQEKCQDCNLCNLINKDNLPSIKIIEPDGAMIRKNQIEELKDSFATIPLYSKYNIYIIKNAEKLNPSSANSMLKFLEEPTDGIIGFFITKNKDVMLDTIKSRCQSLIVKYEEKSIIEKLCITKEIYEQYCKTIGTYLEKIETNKPINHKTNILALYPERSDINNFFQIILEIYYNNFLKKNEMEYNKNINEIYETNDSQAEIIRKINIITNKINNLSYNVNIEQALDSFVIEMRDSNE